MLPPSEKTDLGNKLYPKVHILNYNRGHQGRLLIVQHGYEPANSVPRALVTEFGRSQDDLGRLSGFRNFSLQVLCVKSFST